MGHSGHIWHFFSGEHFWEKLFPFPNKYPNNESEKFILLIMTYQGYIKIAILSILVKSSKDIDMQSCPSNCH